MPDDQPAPDAAPKADDAPKAEATADTVAANPTPHPKPSPLGAACGPLCEVLKPPKQPAAKLLYIGILLLIAPFALKLLTLDLALTNVGAVLEPERLGAKQSYETSSAESVTWELQDQIEDLQSELAEMDYNAEGRKEKQVQLDKLQEDLRAKQKDAVMPKQKDIRKKYRGWMREARLDRMAASASGIGWLQTAFGYLRILLDLVKIAGIVLVLLASMALLVDEEANGHLKTFALVASAVVLVACTLGAFMTALF